MSTWNTGRNGDRCKAIINNEEVVFHFQDSEHDFDEQNPQLDLEYLGFGHRYYVRNTLQTGNCLHIWRNKK